MKKLFFLFILIIALIFSILFLNWSGSNISLELKEGKIFFNNKEDFLVEEISAEKLLALEDHQLIKIKIAEHILTVEVVNTAESINQGLSGRDKIGSDGMLFVFPEKEIVKFWMKEMRFDLDLVWMDDDKIVDITANVPAPTKDMQLSDLSIYNPKVPVNIVLELEAGKAASLGLEES
ncbi:MAG: DUF192 domain-containing protein [Candidatus Woesebacteria bacterium]|jgi:uncharacterized membrane protein (UPF0127 family)